MSTKPDAMFPSYDGSSETREDTSVYREPDGADWDQMVADVIKHQDYMANSPAGFEMTAVAAAANVTEVTIQAVDQNGDAIAAVVQFDLWLSDSAAGAGHSATAASGTVQAKSASGLVVATQVAKKALTVQTLATGAFVLEITDTAKTAYKVCARAPGTGKTIVGITLATADYGA